MQSRSRGNVKTFLCSVALLSFAFATRAAHPLHVEDMQRLSRVGDAHVSPDGKWVAFSVTRSDVAKNHSVTNIWRIAATGGDPQQLTFAEQGFNGDPRWSPDARYLYFISTRVETSGRFSGWPMDGGDAKQVTSVSTGVDGVRAVSGRQDDCHHCKRFSPRVRTWLATRKWPRSALIIQ